MLLKFEIKYRKKGCTLADFQSVCVTVPLLLYQKLIFERITDIVVNMVFSGISIVL